MFYITVKMSPSYRQMTLEELLFGFDINSIMTNRNENCTRTYKRETVPAKFKNMIDVYHLIYVLHEFNNKAKSLSQIDRHSLYKEFYIPKKSGGFRKIDAPNDELKTMLRILKDILEKEFHAMYHTSAFAYIKGRCTVDAIKRHQCNESKWFAKYDLSNFFGSTTLDFVMKMFGMVFPFSELIGKRYVHPQTYEIMDGERELRQALELAFLDGGLPQGTPISPIITNVMMIPIDYHLANTLRNYNNNSYVYTRYADDFLISSRYDFDFKEIENLIKETLNEFDAPFNIKSAKTRYGSSAGSNWNLGVMLNKDNEITVGHKRKKYLKNALAAFANDCNNNVIWCPSDVNVLLGHYSYCHMVEASTIDNIVDWVNKKYNLDVLKLLNELKTQNW